MADRSRTFEEVVDATDPEEIARLNRGEKYADTAVADQNQREVRAHEDRYGSGEWHVSYFDDDGGCYITVFAGRKQSGGRGSISALQRAGSYAPSAR